MPCPLVRDPETKLPCHPVTVSPRAVAAPGCPPLFAASCCLLCGHHISVRPNPARGTAVSAALLRARFACCHCCEQVVSGASRRSTRERCHRVRRSAAVFAACAMRRHVDGDLFSHGESPCLCTKRICKGVCGAVCAAGASQRTCWSAGRSPGGRLPSCDAHFAAVVVWD